MARKSAHPDDPRALIAEAYRIEGLMEADARAIFFDWALALPEGVEPGPAAARLIEAYAVPADHPMTELLRAAIAGRPAGTTAIRRGGRRRNGAS
ncbi:MAG: hypothetical protein ACFBRM_03065 [Pikeienuella sp.]